ncbi:MAG TPA: hypothetical protein VKQ30_11900 [Ktedonobacterales bacterium]|nr:hypothetical protein [Ktedonobacterales bacterium]
MRPPLSGLARQYQDRVSVRYDPSVDALQLQFDNCRMHSAEEVKAAFDALEAQVADVLAHIGRGRCALLVDIAGLDIGDGSTQDWGRALRYFLGQFCVQTSADHFLIARYNSRAATDQLSPADIQNAVTSIQIMTEAAIQGFRSNIVRSREEAVALILRLRQLAQISGY